MRELKLRAVLFQDQGWWIIQCLEHDIAVQGRTPTEAWQRMIGTLICRVQAGKEMSMDDAFGYIPKAPRRYWEMYENATPRPASMELEMPTEYPSRPAVELRVA